MTLVERFSDFREWHTSRKSALAGASILVGQLACIVGIQVGDPTWLDVPRALRLLWVGAAISFLFMSVGWALYRGDADGRWLTGYAFLFGYSLWLVVTIVSMGGVATAVVALLLVLPLVNTLWYDARMGVVTVACVFGYLVTAFILDLTGVAPFAASMRLPDVNSGGEFLVLLVLLAGFAALVYPVGFAAVAASDIQRRRLERAHTLIRRYVPEQVAEAVLSDTPESVDQHERRKLTIFFSDLVGFTDLSEELEPEDLASVLHDYFTEMDAIARRHGGTVDDLVGDAILVLFGAPDRTDDRDQALRAVRMAMEMQDAMGPLNQRWASAGIPETLTVRMGINTGVATIGNFGSKDRTKYTALGKQVNIAARVQSQCQPGKVLISHPTWLLVHEEIPCTPVGELTLKGLNKPMPAYEVERATQPLSEST